MCIDVYLFFFFFNDTATTEIYTLSLHDALPISDLAQLRAYRARPLCQIGVSAVLTYLGPRPSSASSSRPPKATGSPATSKIGNSTRAWKASRSPRGPVRTSPASVSSSGRNPLPRRCPTSASQLPPGAHPSRNRSATARSIPRDDRYVRALRPSGEETRARW